MKQILVALFISFQLVSYEQNKEKLNVYNLPIPKNLDECFVLLDKSMSEIEINLVKTIQEDKIYNNSVFENGATFFHAWNLDGSSILTKYFNEKGLYDSKDIYETILISYHRYLNKENINFDEQIKKRQVKLIKDNDDYIAIIAKDTLNGVYIPKDLKDCFVQLDKFLSEKDKSEIKNLKEREKTISYHHSLGLWIRNNWGLWGKSRLKIYLTNHGCQQPDDMSSTILEFYYDWLNNRNEKWQKWDFQSKSFDMNTKR